LEVCLNDHHFVASLFPSTEDVHVIDDFPERRTRGHGISGATACTYSWPASPSSMQLINICWFLFVRLRPEKGFDRTDSVPLERYRKIPAGDYDHVIHIS